MTTGTKRVLLPALTGAALMLAAILASGAITQRAEAAAASKVSAKMAAQAEYTAALEKLLARCLTKGDQPIVIGDELWMCSATNTGIKMK